MSVLHLKFLAIQSPKNNTIMRPLKKSLFNTPPERDGFSPQIPRVLGASLGMTN